MFRVLYFATCLLHETFTSLIATEGVAGNEADDRLVYVQPLAHASRRSMPYPIQQLAMVFLQRSCPLCHRVFKQTVQFPRARSGLQSVFAAAQELEYVHAMKRNGESLDDVETDSESDVDMICDITSEVAESCVIRYREDSASNEDKDTLLAAVRRCNTYDSSDFFPVLVGKDQVGWVSMEMLHALQEQLMQEYTCKLVDLENSSIQFARMTVDEALPRARRLAVALAPGADSTTQRSQLVDHLVEHLVQRRAIPVEKLRYEKQDVYPMAFGLASNGRSAPALQVERAAMIYFGVPSYGVHINGWVRDPKNSHNPRPWGVWIAKRSLSKATYAGLFDQMVAGGQPSGMSFLDNARKECDEEASLPSEVIDLLQATGLVSYRYATRKGLSTKILATYDLEMPAGLQPVCSDGEVESFTLKPIVDVLRSIREDLPLWKPNSAVVMIDFAMRHGFIDFDEPGYMEIAHLLRAGVEYKIK